MTISDVSNVKTYTGNGVTTAYSTVFSFYESTDLIVKVSGSVTTAYTATGGNGAVGTITFTSAPASSAPIIIERLVTYEQQSDFVNYDGNPADATEKQFDLLAMQCQQLRDSIERSVTVPVGTTGFDPEVAVTGNGGKFLQLKTDLSGFAFSNAVDPGELTVSDYIETLLDDTDASTARGTLGLGSIATKDISFTASKQGALLTQNSTDDGFVFLNSQGTSGQVLTSAGADSLPVFQDVSNISISAGGTGQTTALAGFDALKQDATTSYKGVVELATSSEAQGSSASVVLTPSSMASNTSFGTNGYVLLPGGLILQYGRVTTTSSLTSVSFPVTFPNSARAVFCQPVNANFNAAAENAHPHSITTSGFSVAGYLNNTGSVCGDVNWYAIGN